MKRNITLDYFKIILSILVVFRHFSSDLIYETKYFQHLSFPQLFTVWEFMSLGKLSVPIFLMIGGYFINLTDRKKTIKYFKRILILYVVWMIFYSPWFAEYEFFYFIIILLKGFYHLWYLAAVLGGIVVYYIFRKLIKNDILLLALAFILFLTGYLIEITIDDYHGMINQLYYRNGLFVGFPFLAVGQFIRNNDFSKYKKYMPYLVITGILLVLVEGSMYLSSKFYYDIYVSSIFVCPVLFICVLQYGKIREIVNPDITLVSSGIYFIHPFLIEVRNSFLPQTELILYQFPFIVIVTIFASILIIQANKSIKVFL